MAGIKQKIFSILSSRTTDFLLAILWVLFAYANLKGFEASGRFSLLLSTISQGVIVLFFILRTSPKKVTQNPVEWLAAFSATFLATLVRPYAPLSENTGILLISMGIIMNAAAIISLNRSFGMVPAEREIRTGGLYRFVRHPIYASDFLIMAGYFLANSSYINLAIITATIILLLFRIKWEEKLLSENSKYQEYCLYVRYKLLPFVY